MGRRVLEPVEDRQPRTGTPSSASTGTAAVTAPTGTVTRRSLREAEPGGQPSGRGVATSSPRDSRRPPGGRSWLGQRPRRHAGKAALVLGLVAAGLSLFGDSAAQAQVVSSGQLSLRPGAAQVVDSGTRFADGVGSVAFDVPGVPEGGGLYLGLQLRAGSSGAYVAKARVWSDGRVTVGLTQETSGRTARRLGDVRTGAVLTGPARLNLDVAVAGSSPARLAVRAWVNGQSRPPGQLTANDAASGPAVSGSFRVWGYLSTSASGAVTVPFTQLGAVSADPVATDPTSPTPTAAPTTAPTATPTTAPPTSTTSTARPSTPATTPTTPAPSAPAESSGGQPGAGNTGVPAGTKLTVHDGDLTITQAGATYDRLDVHGFVTVAAPDVTIKNSIIRGGSTTASRGVVQSTNANVKNLVIQDSEIRVEHPSNTLDGIDGGNFTLRRVEVNGGVDNVHAFKDNVTIEDSWLHGANFFSVGANGDGGPSHNDGVQVLGGKNITVTGSRIEGARNAAMMVSQSAGATVNLQVRNNWLNDGGCTVNIVPKDLSSIGPIFLAGNVFGGTTRVANCPVAQTHSTTLVASNNVYAGNGQPIKINVWN